MGAAKVRARAANSPSVFSAPAPQTARSPDPQGAGHPRPPPASRRGVGGAGGGLTERGATAGAPRSTGRGAAGRTETQTKEARKSAPASRRLLGGERTGAAGVRREQRAKRAAFAPAYSPLGGSGEGGIWETYGIMPVRLRYYRGNAAALPSPIT